MPSDDEVIVVEDFYNDLQQTKMYNTLYKKYQKLKEETKQTEGKFNRMNYAHKDLQKQIFTHVQRWSQLARLLGFDKPEDMEASIKVDDPWIPGGKVALSKAHSRILELEDELAKQVVANKEAQEAIMDAKERLNQRELHLEDALSETVRLREQRDVARREAEKQAMEAKTWRLELQDKIPEMQDLIRELQKRKNDETNTPASNKQDKENPAQSEPNSSPLPPHGISTISSPTVVQPSPTTVVSTLAEDGHHEIQLKLLQAQYAALLEAKNTISTRYAQDVMKWKNYKAWVLKDETQRGADPNTQRRIMRRKKALEKIGPTADIDAACPTDNIQSLVRVETVKDADITLIGSGDDEPAPNNDLHIPENQWHVAVGNPLHPSADHKEKRTICLSSPILNHNIAPSPPVPTSGLSPPRSESSRLRVDSLAENILLTQNSLTQPSSPLSSSPKQHPELPRTVTKPSHKRPVIVIDSSPDRNVADPSFDCQEDAAAEGPPSLKRKVINGRISSLRTLGTPAQAKAPQSMPNPFSNQQSQQSFSEPPPTRKSAAPLRPKTPNTHTIRRSSTVLALDTPPRAVDSIPRHHSSPPDSPHMQRLSRRKRKATEMDGNDHKNTDASDENPFRAESLFVRAKLTTVQTREEKLVHLKTLNKKPHRDYMAEYMQFKGRGRYSNANGAILKTMNGEFEINPDKNDGLNYQYDGVVRDKEERKRLEAGDCECCKDYYDAIGPLPPRLQAPLWKSPSPETSKRAARPCRHKNSDTPSPSPTKKARTKAISAHKKEISRHRHDWAPPTTPPDFWKIGFPDSQEVNDINRRANDMHVQKFKRVEAEAKSNNGRFRKRN